MNPDVNPNKDMFQPGGSGNPAPTTSTQTPTTTPSYEASMPASGSVVDLLKNTGGASDYSSRSKLAGQLGIQGYKGTAAQNIDLAKKYIDFYNKNKGSQAPENGGDARSQIQSGTENTQTPTTTPNVDAFFQSPAFVQSVQDLMKVLSPPQVTSDLFDQMSKIQGEQATLSKESLDMMNLNTIMSGTSDDIRNEISKAGGQATESQVQAMTTARNNTLLKQASYLQNQMDFQQSLITNDTSLLSFEKDMANTQFSEKSNVIGMVQQNQYQMNTVATDAFQKIVTNAGYSALADATKGNPQKQMYAEQLLGLSPGTLSDPDALKALETYRQQQLKQGQQKIVIQSSSAGTLADYRASMEASRYSGAANNVVNKYLSLPSYKYFASAAPLISRISAASSVPGSVSDQDLLDAVTQLNTGGNRVTEAQVGIILQGKSFSDTIDVMKKKLSTGGILSDSQRQQLQTIAQKVYENYQKSYEPVKGAINKALKNSQIPSQYWNVPNLDDLQGSSGGASGSAYTSSSGQAYTLPY